VINHLSVPCPHCRSAVGEACPLRFSRAHSSRIKAACAAVGLSETETDVEVQTEMVASVKRYNDAYAVSERQDVPVSDSSDVQQPDSSETWSTQS
jgi:hypothetical protein